MSVSIIVMASLVLSLSGLGETFDCRAESGTRTGMLQNGQGGIFPLQILTKQQKKSMHYLVTFSENENQVWAIVKSIGMDSLELSGKNLVFQSSRMQPAPELAKRYSIDKDFPENCNFTSKKCLNSVHFSRHGRSLTFTFINDDHSLAYFDDIFIINGTCRAKK